MSAETSTVVAEQAVLGALMLSREAYWRVADILKVEDFSRKDHRVILQGIIELVKRDDPCDAVTLGEWFESQNIAELVGGAGYIIQLANNTPSAANIRAYAEIVAKHAMHRRVLDAGAKITKIEGDDALAQAQSLIGELADRVPVRLSSPKEAFKDWVGTFQQRMDSTDAICGLSTGLSELDAKTTGLQAGDLIIIAARPSMGKSLLAQNISDRAALAGNRVAFFSLEMTTQQLINRAISAAAGVPHDKVRSAKNIDADDWNKIERVAEQVQAMPAMWSEASGQTIDQIIAQIRRAHAQKPLTAVFIDYLGLIRLPKSERRHDLLVGDITRQLKDQAKQLNIPIVLLAQLNRGVEGRTNKRPTLADLRDSGEIEQHADVVIFIHREEYFDRASEMKGVAELIIAKQRNGETCTVHVASRLEVCRFDDFSGEIPSAKPREQQPQNVKSFGRKWGKGNAGADRAASNG